MRARPKRWRPELLVIRDQILALLRDADGTLSSQEISRVFVRMIPGACDGTHECFDAIDTRRSPEWSQRIHVAAGMDVRRATGSALCNVTPELNLLARAGWIERVGEREWRLGDVDLIGLDDMPPLNVTA